jgi:hypothetical protein
MSQADDQRGDGEILAWAGPVDNLAEIATEVITSALKYSE